MATPSPIGSDGPAVISSPATAIQRVSQGHGGTLTPWAKGVSGNPAGRPTAGASYREWLNQMRDWTEAEIRAVADNPKESVTKRQAARSHLRALEEGRYHAVPLAANDLDRICDRTDGRPTQRVAVAQVDRDPEELMAELRSLLEANPGLEDFIARMTPVDANDVTEPQPESLNGACESR